MTKHDLGTGQIYRLFLEKRAINPINFDPSFPVTNAIVHQTGVVKASYRVVSCSMKKAWTAK